MSNDTFEIGEVAIYWRPESPYHKCEVTILSKLYLSKVIDALTDNMSLEFIHIVEFQENVGLNDKDQPFAAPPHKLRKKRPPREDHQVTRWAECPWQPAKETT